MKPILPVRDLILARLKAQPNWNVYDGEPPAQVPVDATGKALAYACLYMAPAWADETTESLAADGAVEGVTWQVTVASGYVTTTLNAAAKADAALLGWFGDTDGVVRRDIAPQIRADRDVSPARWFLPLTYRVDLG